ncbi:Protein N-lysine methyltransferase METTL21A [Symbiodinium microadriaticum]|uniref:Protein N-lysine methyltransferase METTL21A n=1 Tax=Symbiodinium microadriaticum TaxID=2951 RepID=A0A1Q9DBM7_SYMMI|nr:Protein N-lysine methyltransferase METTL21A [Symbiodinium microadriaticum]
MPRQGARKKQRQRAASGKASQASGDVPPVSEGKKALKRAERVGPSADIEAALTGRGKRCDKLFELASRPAIRVAVGGSFVEVAQDRSTQEHSGGVVWETAFFLLRYLQQAIIPGLRRSEGRPLRVVELGAGCGLLGLGLSRLGCEVVLTEQHVAMENLVRNVEAANKSLQGEDFVPAEALELDWGSEANMTAVRSKGSFDLVVGSDIVFASRLVQPLILTIRTLLKGSSSATCWLCLQRRDPDAHALLLVEAGKHFKVQEHSFAGCDGLEAACELECILLCLKLTGEQDMDMDLEHLEPVGGIPMPPEAWELLSIWSEVWDAPRFRAHGLASARLSREAVMPLLKLAASCVAAVRSHLQGSSAALTVPLHGASRELLVQEKRIVSEAGQVQNELLSRCLKILVVEQAAQKPKDWIEFWAKMNVPVDSQSRVLTEIIAFCLNEPPVGGLGAVLAELIKGHRVKTRAVEEAVETAMAGGQDARGVLRQMLFSIYPKSPDSDWGWARVGWSWQEWWKIVERTIGGLEKLAAFDELGLLLERLAKVRDSLCKFAEVTDTDLQACLAASLTSATVAAADAESKGKGLPDPRRNPVDFVHELVHAAFLTGDGEYADGMSEVQIDELMKTCCEAQLEFGKSLTRNPTVALEAAYSKLQEIVREVLEAPPEEGDLAGVAGRWMLAGQLRRVAEDAALLVPTKREQSQGEIEAEVDESTVSHTDVEMDSEDAVATNVLSV